MVMHARKPQRVGDGYFDKHQAHSYQKYNSKNERRPNTGEYGPPEGHFPVGAPNGSISHGHGPHPAPGYHHYNHYPEERGYSTSRNSYVQQKGCSKERDRDYKTSRNKYADSDIIPSKRSKDSERDCSNQERSDPSKKARTIGVNSTVNRSNSKYNKRNVSSSSVPPGSEWSEHISSSGKKYYYNCVSEVSQWEQPREWAKRNTSKDSMYTSRTNHEKRPSNQPKRESDARFHKRPYSNTDRYWNSSNSRDADGQDRVRSKYPSGTFEDGHLAQEMDISPDRSTPFSENSYGRRSNVRSNAETSAPPVVVLDHSNHQGGSLLAAALPRIIPGPTTSNGDSISPSGDTCGTVVSGTTSTPRHDAGPPTPTHSENTDPHATPIYLETALPRKMESLGAYSSVVGSTNVNSTPMLTPSLVNYVRNDLTAHVSGWTADLLERQANKFADEAYQLGCLQSTRVSAELKCTRSLVRHTEIQATLQEQKMMYLRQQVTVLEAMKSQNSFMSDD